MTTDERIAHWEMRQEALITSMNGLLDVQEVIRDMIAELAAWLKQPASNALPDLIQALLVETQAHRADLAHLAAAIAELPAAVARAVKDGEVRG